MTASTNAAGVGGTGSGGTGGTKSKSKASAAKATGAGTQAKQKKKRKAVVPKNTSTAPSQATLAAAQKAKNDLAHQHRQAAARITDPLWYRIEDLLPPQHQQQEHHGKVEILPDQIQIVEAALSHNHLTRSDVTPQAMACLLEQARRYAHELLEDAHDYASLANRLEPSKADLQLAAEMRADHPISVHSQLPKLNLMARQVNKIPLPPIPSHCYSGIVLPPREHQLTARTYDVVIGAKVSQKMVPPPVIPSTTASSSPSKPLSSQKPGYGASRGTQIPILLKKDKDDPATAKQDAGPSTGPDATPSGSAMSAPMVPPFNL